ncbi:MAG TPA: PEP-utilizing enzyme [Patescibacteria group bacterium]|nr:PEP-utilizing enzyme [Patescibacteria group bacterium]
MTKWVELAHDKKTYIYPTAIYWLGAQLVCREIGAPGSIIATWYKHHNFSYLVSEGNFIRAGQLILDRLEKDPAFLEKIITTNEQMIPAMLAAAEKLHGDLTQISGHELYQRWQNWLHTFLALMTYSAMGTVMEMEEPLLSNRLEQIIKDRLGENQQDLGKCFQILTTSTTRTVAGEEEQELLRLRQRQLTTGLSPEEISVHQKRYSWIGFGYTGPGWNCQDIEDRLSALPDTENGLKQFEEEKNKTLSQTLAEQTNWETRLGLTEKEKYLFQTLRTLGFWKFERKFQNQKAHELMEDFIREIARRNNLSILQAKMIGPNEMEDVLIHNRVNPDQLNERLNESVVVFSGSKCEVWEGSRGKEILTEIHQSLAVNLDQTIIKGSTAYPGIAQGTARQVNTVEDMQKLQPGDILISTSTSPQILPAMKKAAAIVTDSGGITCHAAIVAREIKIPTVIGTKIATKIIKDGDQIRVDADQAIITIIK